jgi:hypothetical protein
VADNVNTAWDELPPAVRQGIERHTGPVAASFPGGDGVSTMVRLVLDTAGGSVFVKGVSPDAGALARERLDLGAALARFVTGLSPPLLFRVQACGWDVTGWHAVPGRPADLRPGSADIQRVVGILAELGAVRAPDVPLRSVAEDWAAPADDPGALDGDMLVHTDVHGGNFIVGADRVWLVDWGWAKRGPAWMTAARLALFLMEAGWEPADAERALADVPAWAEAPPGVVTAYALSSVGSWERACRQQPDNKGLQVWLGLVRRWADHRAGAPGVRTSHRLAGSLQRQPHGLGQLAHVGREGPNVTARPGARRAAGRGGRSRRTAPWPAPGRPWEGLRPAPRPARWPTRPGSPERGCRRRAGRRRHDRGARATTAGFVGRASSMSPSPTTGSCRPRGAAGSPTPPTRGTSAHLEHVFTKIRAECRPRLRPAWGAAFWLMTQSGDGACPGERARHGYLHGFAGHTPAGGHRDRIPTIGYLKGRDSRFIGLGGEARVGGGYLDLGIGHRAGRSFPTGERRAASLDHGYPQRADRRRNREFPAIRSGSRSRHRPM